MAEVEILDVVRVPLSSQFFLNGLIDTPATGDCVERYGLMLVGWVLRHDAEPARRETIVRGTRRTEGLSFEVLLDRQPLANFLQQAARVNGF